MQLYEIRGSLVRINPRRAQAGDIWVSRDGKNALEWLATPELGVPICVDDFRYNGETPKSEDLMPDIILVPYGDGTYCIIGLPSEGVTVWRELFALLGEAERLDPFSDETMALRQKAKEYYGNRP